MLCRSNKWTRFGCSRYLVVVTKVKHAFELVSIMWILQIKTKQRPMLVAITTRDERRVLYIAKILKTLSQCLVINQEICTVLPIAGKEVN